jgi:hypothetical protein
MEAKDAWLLFAGAFLGFVGSLLATFAAPPLSTAFGKLKSGFIERNKAKALARYSEVRDLRSGKRDKYFYAINHWGVLTFITVTTPLAVLLGFETRIAFGLPHTGAQASIAAVVVALLLAVFLLRRTLRFLLTLGRLENFENYRAQLLRRWPDIVLPE